MEYVTKIIKKYFDLAAEKLGEGYVNATPIGLLTMDTHESHTNHELRDLLDELRIEYVYVPANCTDFLQVMDLVVNRPFKHKVKESFEHWYANQVYAQLNEGVSPENVKIDLSLNAIKNSGEHAKWIINAWNYINEKNDLILKGWSKVGFQSQVISSNFDNDTNTNFDSDTNTNFDNDTNTNFDNDTNTYFDNDTNTNFDNDTNTNFGYNTYSNGSN